MSCGSSSADNRLIIGAYDTGTTVFTATTGGTAQTHNTNTRSQMSVSVIGSYVAGDNIRCRFQAAGAGSPNARHDRNT